MNDSTFFTLLILLLFGLIFMLAVNQDFKNKSCRDKDRDSDRATRASCHRAPWDTGRSTVPLDLLSRGNRTICEFYLDKGMTAQEAATELIRCNMYDLRDHKPAVQAFCLAVENRRLIEKYNDYK